MTIQSEEPSRTAEHSLRHERSLSRSEDLPVEADSSHGGFPLTHAEVLAGWQGGDDKVGGDGGSGRRHSVVAASDTRNEPTLLWGS